MQESLLPTPEQTAPRRSLVTMLHDRKVRGMLFQALLALVLVAAGYLLVTNAINNLRAANITSGFGFLTQVSGFNINQALINYDGAVSSYGDAFIVGLLNTLLVAALGICFATMIGFTVGIARLSSNKVVAAAATMYVEVMRNLPLLLHIFFWYSAVLAALPGPRGSLQIGNFLFLNNRGLYMPSFGLTGSGWPLAIATLMAAAAYFLIRRWSLRQQARDGMARPHGFLGALAGVAIIGLAYLASEAVLSMELPQLRGFGLGGGTRVYPELVALLVALSTYTGAFIAEIVRAGVSAVSRGQYEAATALGLTPKQSQKLIITPQAMRIIVPPLTSQFLNLTKNSSLAVAIAYPDLVHVFMGTVLNQTGRAVEIVTITMSVYLIISLCTSVLMGIYNRRVRLIER
ncbi:amino acid ABC transporter permease [Streptomyces cavourensis]|nr:amino acid ABC transporter permease [Streptomyces cavourensis]